MKKSLFYMLILLSIVFALTGCLPTAGQEPPVPVVSFKAYLPENTPDDATIYIVGNYCDWGNGWASGDAATSEVKKDNGKKYAEFKLEISQFPLEYKYTIGPAWDYEEVKADGSPVDNRKIDSAPEGLVEDTIEKWKDIPESQEPTEPPTVLNKNETIMQAFYWEMGTGEYLKNYPEEENLWCLLVQKAPELSEVGITALWLPPANKGAAGGYDVGYGTYDLWDLGEFNQKGTTRTKYGTKKELESAIAALHDKGIKVYYDAALNHRMGADAKGQDQTISAWTVFNFPGRKNKYSDFQWNWQHFDGENWNLFEGKTWDWTFYPDNDYLMGLDVDYENPEVQKDVTDWGKWIINDIDFDGFRLDAAKHIDYRFINQFINDVQKSSSKDLFFVGEAWIEDVSELARFLERVDNEDLKVFDFPLRSFFVDMIDGADLRNLRYVGLVNKFAYKDKAVTFVDNHDTNRDGEKDGILRRKYQAYAYILTREHGIPVVYWKDYYIYNMKNELDKLLEVRKYFAYGPGYEVDNNDEDVYSYVRAGLDEVEGDGLVLMISDGESGEIISKRINSRQPNTTFYDYTGHVQGNIITDERGYGDFKVKKSENEGWSVWVPVIKK